MIIRKKSFNSGFTLVELVVTICILTGMLTIGVSFIRKYLTDNKEELKGLVKDAKEIATTEYQSIPSATSNEIVCIDGFKIIIIDGVSYNIGKKDNWGEIEAEKCN